MRSANIGAGGAIGGPLGANPRSTTVEVVADRSPVQLLFADAAKTVGSMSKADSGSDLQFTVPASGSAVTTPSTFPDYIVWDLGPMSDFLGQSVCLQAYDFVTSPGTGQDVTLFFGLGVATDPTAYDPTSDLMVNFLLHFGHSTDDNDDTRFAIRKDNDAQINGTTWLPPQYAELQQKLGTAEMQWQRRAWEFFGYDSGPNGAWAIGSGTAAHSGSDRFCALLFAGRRAVEALPADMQLKLRFFGRGAPVSAPA